MGQYDKFNSGDRVPYLQRTELASGNGSEPHDTEPEDLAPFPVDTLPPVLRDMAQAIKASLNVTLEMACPLVLATASGALGKGLKTKSGSDLSVFGNLYIIGSAESGSGKSISFKPSISPVIEHDKEIKSYWQEITLPEAEAEIRILEKEISALEKNIGKKVNLSQEYRSDIRMQLADKLKELNKARDKRKEPSIITEDTTEEALALLLFHNNEQIFSISADAGKALQNLEGRYSNSDTADDNLYVKGRTGDFCKVDRVTRIPILLNEPCIALFWLTQPSKVMQMLDNEDLSNGGFLPRCLIFDTRSEPTEEPDVETPIPHKTRVAYKERIKSLITTYRESTETLIVPPSEDAIKIIRAYRNSLIKRTDLRDIRSFVARWHENAWGIALVIHASLHGGNAHTLPISADTTNNAVKIMKWFAEEQMRVLSNMRYECDLKKIDKLVCLIRERHHGEATMRDLELRNNWNRLEVQRLAEKFDDQLMIGTREPTKKGGRPSPVVTVL